MRKSGSQRSYIVLYEIACMLHQHLQVCITLLVVWFAKSWPGRQALLKGITLGITLGVPAFHVYGHGAKCQIVYRQVFLYSPCSILKIVISQMGRQLSVYGPTFAVCQK